MDVDVVVIGSINRDTRAAVQRFARPGETIVAATLAVSSGGKGGNQAVAAALAGASVGFVGAVGDDEAGRAELAELDRYGIDRTEVRTIPDLTTGSAFICVDPSGENTIVVSPGANARVSGELSPTDHRGKVVLVQNEIPWAAVESATRFAEAAGSRLVMNPAPVPSGIPAILAHADPLIVNEHEAAGLLGEPAPAQHDLARALSEATGARSVVVTLGAAGSIVFAGGVTTVVPSVPVARVVDTTGAGDTFVGALAAHLAHDLDLVAAAQRAAAAAAESVTWLGARPPVLRGGEPAPA